METRQDGNSQAHPHPDGPDRIFTDTLDASAISSNSATLGIKNWLFLPNAPHGESHAGMFANDISHVHSPDLFDGDHHKDHREARSSQQFGNFLNFSTEAIPNAPSSSNLPFLGSNHLSPGGLQEHQGKTPFAQFSPPNGAYQTSLGSGRTLSTANLQPQPQPVSNTNNNQAPEPRRTSNSSAQGHEQPQPTLTLSGGPNYSAATLKYLNRFGGISLPAMHTTNAPTPVSGPSTPTAGAAPRGSTFNNKSGLLGVSLTALSGRVDIREKLAENTGSPQTNKH